MCCRKWSFLLSHAFILGQNSCFEFKQNQSFHRRKCSGFFFQRKEIKGQKRKKISDSLGSDDDGGSFQAFIRRASSSSAGPNGGRRGQLTAEVASRWSWRQIKLLVNHKVTTPPEAVSISTATIAQGPSGQSATKRWREGVKECRRGNNTIVCFRPRG